MKYIICKLINEIFVPVSGEQLTENDARQQIIALRMDEHSEVFVAMAVLSI